ncbi:hypothetical protein [Dictyobacter formicarum]|uniref:Uncharacterized protein n=1 Tax=Dictyobacter formicarum TaxID=2778368 RepID=A0ABQ3VS15_9CHLR|nr:hypothetical protein [Dictyobacter formicarum]GHO88489.1 hypothetical protein KSZ_64950 [Dictyobacter formicarum]
MVTTGSAQPDKATPAGLQAHIYTVPTVHANGTPGWTTYWQLSWERVPAATYYLVYYATAEGNSPTPHPTSEPVWRLSIAAGIGVCEADQLEKEDYLLATQLQIIVVAQFADGSTGSPTEPVAVGVIL